MTACKRTVMSFQRRAMIGQGENSVPFFIPLCLAVPQSASLGGQNSQADRRRELTQTNNNHCHPFPTRRSLSEDYQACQLVGLQYSSADSTLQDGGRLHGFLPFAVGLAGTEEAARHKFSSLSLILCKVTFFFKPVILPLRHAWSACFHLRPAGTR